MVPAGTCLSLSVTKLMSPEAVVYAIPAGLVSGEPGRRILRSSRKTPASRGKTPASRGKIQRLAAIGWCLAEKSYVLAADRGFTC